MNKIKSRDKKISVIIPTHNRLFKLKKCLSLVFSQIPDSGEVIVVENLCSDGTLNILKKMTKHRKNLTVLIEKRPGPSYARNLALNHANGKILVFLDDDSFIEPGYFEEIKKVCFPKNNVNTDSVYQGAITHKFDSDNLLSKIFYARLESVWKLLYTNDPFWKNKKQIHHLNACNFFMRREVLDKLEYLFDEKEFPFVGEERELSERLNLLNIQILYCNTAKIIHSKKTADLSRFVERAYADGKSEGLLEKKYKAPKWKLKLFNKDLEQLHKPVDNADSWKEAIKLLSDESMATKLKIYLYSALHQILFNFAYYKAKYIDYEYMKNS